MNSLESIAIFEPIPDENLRRFAFDVGKSLSRTHSDIGYSAPEVVNGFVDILKTLCDLLVKQKNEANEPNLVSMDLRHPATSGESSNEK